MKLVRFWEPSAQLPLWGVAEGDGVYVLAGDPYDGIKPTRAAHSLSSVRLLPPCVASKIVCGGLNYVGHAREAGLPIPKVSACFFKPSSALIGHGDAIEYPAQTQRLEYEGELAVVIKRRMRNTAPEEVPDHILGYACGNDVTARDIQVEGGNLLNLSVSKAFDTFNPVGPWLVTGLDPHDLGMTLTVNGAVRQKSRTSDMIFPVEVMLSYFSSIMTLLPGDLIMTGTPEGIGQMQVGDVCEVTIEGIGALRNPVVAAPSMASIDARMTVQDTLEYQTDVR
jgi:2-keto-4-pentenoate hydratase/2-oxohepta-3-ene-1,7-dioic acid hydratase in catechol pathway